MVVFCVQKAYSSSYTSRFIRRFLLLPYCCVLKALKHCMSSDWHSENLILFDRCSLILKHVWSIFFGSVFQCLYFNARILAQIAYLRFLFISRINLMYVPISILVVNKSCRFKTSCPVSDFKKRTLFSSSNFVIFRISFHLL
jgi:hypothetical protein